MNHYDGQKTVFLNKVSTIIYDIAYIIWYKNYKHAMNINETNTEVWELNDYITLDIYRCFKIQMKNLLKYSKLILKFRTIEKSIEEIEDLLDSNTLKINFDLLNSMESMCSCIQKCEYYASKMGSIMLQIHENNIINNDGELLADWEHEGVKLEKGKKITVLRAVNKHYFEILYFNKKICHVPSIFIKLNASEAELSIIKRLQQRLKSILLDIINKIQSLETMDKDGESINTDQFEKLLDDLKIPFTKSVDCVEMKINNNNTDSKQYIGITGNIKFKVHVTDQKVCEYEKYASRCDRLHHL